MSRIKQRFAAALVAVCGSLAANADTLTLPGSLAPSDWHWLHADTSASMPTATDVFELTVSVDGFYDVLAFYEGDATSGLNLDGWLFIYEGGDFTLPDTTPVAQSDDYTAGQNPRLVDIEAGCLGSNCSAFTVQLVSGVTYSFVLTSALSEPAATGQPYGDYRLTLSGPGVPLPLPPAAVLYACGLAGLSLLRRRARG